MRGSSNLSPIGAPTKRASQICHILFGDPEPDSGIVSHDL